MNKKILLTLCLLMMLVLSSCQYGPRVYRGPQTTDFNSGTEGITAEFLDQAPPREVFEGSEFDVQLYVHNKGAFSVTEQYGVIVDLTYDSSKVERLTNYDATQQGTFTSLGNIFGSNQGPSNQIVGDFKIEGKNPNWLTGQEDYLFLARFQAKDIPGNFQTNTATFIAQFCYPYQTSFASEICIDTDTQGTSQRQEVCEQQDYSYSGGQGAPVVITAVETQMIPRGVYVQPQFTIHVESRGNGVVSYREIGETYSTALCEDIPTDNLNRLSVVAYLGGDRLDCLPEQVILKGGKGKIQCQLPSTDILGVSSNYQTTLSVELGYQYTESFKKDIVVLKTDDTNTVVTDENECFSWQTLDGTSCKNTCDYLAATKRDYVEFNNIKAVMKQDLADEVDQDYLWSQVGCHYRGSALCKDNPELCILQNGLCPPGDFCGLPQCLLKNGAPRIAQVTKIGTDQLNFYCEDGDDATNIKQTCGCIEQAYYGFIPKNETCKWPSSYSQTSQGSRENIYGILHVVDGLDDPGKVDSKLCIMVKDKLNANSTREINYPFRV